MLEIESYNQANVTWEAAFNASLVLNDAFRNDDLNTEYRPAWLRCESLPIAPYSKLLTFPQFRIAVCHYARFLYMNLRTNPRFLLYLVKDMDKKGKYVACSTIILPEYYPTPPRHPQSNSVWYMLKSAFLKFYFKLQDIWAFKSFTNLLNPPAMLAEFELGSEKCRAVPTASTMQYLSQLTRDQLSNTHVPKVLSYYVNYFAIVYDEQGKGYGKKSMDLVVATLKSQYKVIEPPTLNSPAKLELFSSPMGVGFYKRYGFTVGATHDSVQPSGLVLHHTFFFMNI